MDTHDLIKALGADVATARPPLATTWTLATAASVVAGGLAFLALCGPRPDFAAAAETTRFLFKFVVTLTLAGGAFFAIRTMSRPDGALRRAWPMLCLAPVLLAAAIAAELFTLPSDLWATRLVGTNSLLCLSLIPAIGIVPLAVLIAALRDGAPTRPATAGAVAGLLAGGIAATFYAAHCFDDSPLFVATWYTLAVAIMAVIGAVAARLAVRW